jgi:hypothetical protein
VCLTIWCRQRHWRSTKVQILVVWDCTRIHWMIWKLLVHSITYLSTQVSFVSRSDFRNNKFLKPVWRPWCYTWCINEHWPKKQ